MEPPLRRRRESSGGSSSNYDASTGENGNVIDIEELHSRACRQGLKTYQDPDTGFTVFTEVAHLSRGKCCGSQCRHCPYGWTNVRSGARREDVKAISGDLTSVRRALEALRIAGDGANLTPPTSYAQERRNRDATSPLVGKGGRKGGKFTAKNVPYTRGGDKGTSALFTGERRSKADVVFEAMGTVDELCSFVGVVHAELTSSSSTDYGELPNWLLDVMSRLFDIGSLVARPRRRDNEEEEAAGSSADGVGGGFDEAHVVTLEAWIDIMTDDLPELTSFVLPTGGKASAHLHVCRTVCRRAERRLVPLITSPTGVGGCDPNTLRYLNRLSDLCFTAARWANFREGISHEVLYRRPRPGATQRSRTNVPFA